METHYFGAGPAAMPCTVKTEMAAAILNYEDTGISIMEIPHRGRHFKVILEEATALIKQLCELGDDYEVLWLQGGGRMQFCTIPMSFLQPNKSAAYLDSGHWASEASRQASHYGKIVTVGSSHESNYSSVPEVDMQLLQEASTSYLHCTTNNTIYGTQLQSIPNTTTPLVADMSSDILSQPRNYRAFDMFFAVAQKNLGMAGVTMVAIKKSFLATENAGLPEVFSYTEQVKAGSMLNTPPVVAIYSCLLYLRWLKAQNLKQVFEQNSLKARLLYDEIDRSKNFVGVAAEQDRSEMNATFRLVEESRAAEFLKLCESRNIIGLEGHRSVGGYRASLYNAVSLKSVEVLVKTIGDFF